MVCGLASSVLAGSCPNETNWRFIYNMESPVIGEILPLNINFKVTNYSRLDLDGF